MEEPGRLQSMGSLGVEHYWATSLSLFTFMHWRRKWQPTPMFLPGESQGRGSLVGCRLWGHRVRHDWSDLAAAAAAMMGSEKYLVRMIRLLGHHLLPLVLKQFSTEFDSGTQTFIEDLLWVRTYYVRVMVNALNKKENLWSFPSGTVVGTQHSHCWGPGFSPWLGN